MRKQTLHLEQPPVTDMSVVDEAASWADLLVRREHRGPGDTLDAARLRAARKHKVPEQALWSLRYRKPKDIAGSVYRSLYRAYVSETQSMEAKIAENLALIEALPASAARDRMVAQLARFQADSPNQTQATQAAPRRRSTDRG